MQNTQTLYHCIPSVILIINLYTLVNEHDDDNDDDDDDNER